MMRSIVESSLKLRLLVVAIAVGVMVLGIGQMRQMPVDVLPEFIPPTVEIQTEALGLSAAEVEQMITVPLEQDLLNGVAWLDEIRSDSVPGLSRIQMIFEPGTDLMRARQVVQERLTQAHALPGVGKAPQMIEPQSSTSRIMMVRMSSTELSPIEMSVLARWNIKPRILGVSGVSNVAIFGRVRPTARRPTAAPWRADVRPWVPPAETHGSEHGEQSRVTYSPSELFSNSLILNKP